MTSTKRLICFALLLLLAVVLTPLALASRSTAGDGTPPAPASATSGAPEPQLPLLTAPTAPTAPSPQSGQVAPARAAEQTAAKASRDAAKKAIRLRAEQAAHRKLNALIHQTEKSAWRWEHVYSPATSRASTPERIAGLSYKRYLLKLWRKKARTAYLIATHPPYYSDWLCIHSHEGSWSAATGNGYYGGLQMDYHFMSSYGWWHLREEGTANNWSPLEQIWTAERARSGGRGFYPWPNTARMCGLL